MHCMCIVYIYWAVKWYSYITQIYIYIYIYDDRWIEIYAQYTITQIYIYIYILGSEMI